MHLRLIRHATLLLDVAGVRVLVDPQLDPAGAREPIPNTPNPRRNPLVELPEPAEVVVKGVDLTLVTHRHSDHLDDTALALLPHDEPLVCQPPDAEPLRERGFGAVVPVEDEETVRGLALARTEGRHGTGEVGRRMAPVSGFVIRAPDEPAIYVAGDTVWCDEVREALDRHGPEIVVVNAGAAQFLEGGPITMDAGDVVAVARHAPGAGVVAVHMEAVAHCVETRADLHQRLHDEGLSERVSVPEDGSEVPL